MEIPCITVVVTTNEGDKDFKHFISSTLAADYIAFLPVFEFRHIELFPDKQDILKVIK